MLPYRCGDLLDMLFDNLARKVIPPGAEYTTSEQCALAAAAASVARLLADAQVTSLCLTTALFTVNLFITIYLSALLLRTASQNSCADYQNVLQRCRSCKCCYLMH